MRKILLLPQSAKIKEFIMTQITVKKFPMSECLVGLVDADDLKLDTAEEIFQFITNNLGSLSLRKEKTDPGKMLSKASQTSTERFYRIYQHLNGQDEESKRKILDSLDTSCFTRQEFLNMVRKERKVLKNAIVCGDSLAIYKDTDPKRRIYFFPQHYNKLE